MVKKLLKHEAKYYARTLIIIEAVIFALALFTRLLLFFEFDSIVYYILQGSSYAMFALAAYAALIVTFILCIVRFYKNLFSNEGYLSFTLPVSTNQHLLAKLLSAVVYSIIVFVSVIAAALITVSGDILNEVVKAGVYLLKDLIDVLPKSGTIHLILYVIEFIVIMLLSVISSYLLYYCFIAIGQTAKKNRILLSVGCYFIYSAAIQIFSTIFSIVMTIAEPYIPYEALERFVDAHPFAFFHIIFIALIIWSVILTVVFYFVVQRIISRKLNLE
ncbi:MAG: hypothetical protein E7545_01960 [Ruminococcaceae bacterium]|nr:hypothetical protein [Oscillospiraceae bacterium]